MATRAPRASAPKNNPTKPRGGSGRPSASRTSASRTSASRGQASRSSAARKGSTPYYRSRGGYSKPSPASAMRASHNPFLILIGWVVAGIAAVWMELAGGVGYVARLFGDNARDLAPGHRRDGLGLAVLAAAIVTAGASWWHLHSSFGRAITELVR